MALDRTTTPVYRREVHGSTTLAMVARAREDPGKLRVAPFYDTEARTHTVRY
jgi:hypothetical protein